MHSDSAVTERDDVESQSPRTAERACTAVEGGTSRENIVDEDVMMSRIKGRASDECKGIFQIRHSRATVERGLRLRVDRTMQQWLNLRGTASGDCQRFREQNRLVVPTFTRLSGVKRNRHEGRATDVIHQVARAPEYFRH